MVCDNIFQHNRDTDIWRQLLSAPLVERTYDTLRRLHDHNSRAMRRRRDDWERFVADCVTTPISRQEWNCARREYENWRKHAETFATVVGHAMREVRQARRQITKDSRRGDEGNPQFYRGRLRDVALAVYRHRAAITGSDVIAEDHDRDLWRILETITVPYGSASEPTSLLTMLDERYWS